MSTKATPVRSALSSSVSEASPSPTPPRPPRTPSLTHSSLGAKTSPLSKVGASTHSSSSSLTLPDVNEDPDGDADASGRDNPGMTSGEDTPGSSYPDAMPDHVTVTTPPLKNAPEIEILGADGNPDHDADVTATYPPELAHDDASNITITKDDVAADPILHDLADSQASDTSIGRYSGLGPRLSKSAALRMGLKWEDPRDIRRVSGEDVPVNFDNVPGHKRSGLDLNVQSLAEPSLAPRTNRAAMLRAGHPDEPTRVVKDRAEMAAANKAREAAERAERRKSMPRPTSLLLPTQLPRQNRAALLRAGQPIEREVKPKYDAAEFAENAARNKARDQAEYAERRRTIQVPASLGAPAITPRGNRASMLRTNTGDVTSPPPRPPRSHMRASTQSISGSARSSISGSGALFKTAGDRALAGKVSAAHAAAEKAAEAERKERARRRQTMAALPSGEAAGPAALTYNEEKAAAERAALARIAAKKEEEARRVAEKAAQDRADRERIEKRRSMTHGRGVGANAIKEVPEPLPESEAEGEEDAAEEETAEEREARELERERVLKRQTFGTAPASSTSTSTSPIPPAPSPALRSLGAPAIAPRANRASLLREKKQAAQAPQSHTLSRTSSRASAVADMRSPPTRSRAGSNANSTGASSVGSDAAVKTHSPKKKTSKLATMPTPSKFVAPRPAPAPPRARPVSSISFALPEKQEKKEKKKEGLFGRLINSKRSSVIGVPESRPGSASKRRSVISSPSPQL